MGACGQVNEWGGGIGSNWVAAWGWGIWMYRVVLCTLIFLYWTTRVCWDSCIPHSPCFIFVLFIMGVECWVWDEKGEGGKVESYAQPE